MKTRGYMSSFATIARNAVQLKADPRTIALILVLPALLLTLLYYIFVDVPVPPGQAPIFDTIGPIMLAILPMLLMFIVTSVVMLRERTSGTLERILTTPLSRWNLIASYAAVFGGLAILQSLILASQIVYRPADTSVRLVCSDRRNAQSFGVVANVLPMTWAVDVVNEVLTATDLTSDSWLRAGLLVAATLVALLLAAKTMPRAT